MARCIANGVVKFENDPLFPCLLANEVPITAADNPRVNGVPSNGGSMGDKWHTTPNPLEARTWLG